MGQHCDTLWTVLMGSVVNFWKSYQFWQNLVRRYPSAKTQWSCCLGQGCWILADQDPLLPPSDGPENRQISWWMGITAERRNLDGENTPSRSRVCRSVRRITTNQRSQTSSWGQKKNSWKLCVLVPNTEPPSFYIWKQILLRKCLQLGLCDTQSCRRQQ